MRYARVFKVSTDELLGLKLPKRANGVLSLKIVRRLQGIENLPPAKQKALLQTIDAFLRDAKRGG